MEGDLTGEPVVSYASCGHDLRPLWSTDVRLESGSNIYLEERFLPSENDISTGPASLVRADFRLEGQQQTSYRAGSTGLNSFSRNCTVVSKPMAKTATLFAIRAVANREYDNAVSRRYNP
jgi:hypothetical protein